MKTLNSQTCSFCHMEIETVEHLFFNCVNVKDIWIYVFKELQKRQIHTLYQICVAAF